MYSIGISIIIVNWNTKTLLLQCLNGIEHGDFEIIVVDNASSDGSVKACRQKFPSVIVIENQSNLGFAKANNIGAAVATGRFLLFLNSDTIPTKATILGLYNVLIQNKSDIVGPKLIYPDGRLQLASAHNHPTPLSEFLRNIDITGKLNERCVSLKDYDASQFVESVSGAAMMMRREVYIQLGGWPEDYFMYAEDSELCARAVKQHFRVFYAADLLMIHIHGGSSKKSIWRVLRSTWISFVSMNKFLRHHYGYMASLLHAPQYPVQLVTIIIRKILRVSKRFVR